ncbi:hypothetical protein [Actinomadura miaoliensis]|uniref:Uncharacterized protein n=1 Tax=Actinomadura miaoliensis TaxID=430685 RepID=A0ABP7VKW0_9ACTN
MLLFAARHLRVIRSGRVRPPRCAPPRRHGLVSALVSTESPKPRTSHGHTYLGGLGFYVRLGEETDARITAEHDPAPRHRRR